MDGAPVSFQQESSAGGQGNFANSTLYLMSRGRELPLRSRDTGRARRLQPDAQPGHDLRPLPLQRRQREPHAVALGHSEPCRDGQNVTLDASASTDSAASITDYRWDMDNSGTYSTDTGTTPKLTTSFATAGDVQDRPAGDRRQRQRRPDDHGILSVTPAPPTTPVLSFSGDDRKHLRLRLNRLHQPPGRQLGGLHRHCRDEPIRLGHQERDLPGTERLQPRAAASDTTLALPEHLHLVGCRRQPRRAPRRSQRPTTPTSAPARASTSRPTRPRQPAGR